MRIRRKTAVGLCLLAILLPLAGTTWYVTRPDYLRGQLLVLAKRVLSDGYEARLDSVDYRVWEGTFEARGLRVLREGPEGALEEVVSIPRVELHTRLWELVASLRPTDVVIRAPELTLEVREDGTVSPLDILRPGGPEGTGEHPRVVVEGGLLRVRSAAHLAPGQEARLRIEALDLDVSRRGEPSFLRADLREEGVDGRGALGRITVRGDASLRGGLAPSGRGLTVAVERFVVDEFMASRLAAPIRERLDAVVAFDGTFGEGPGKPGVEATFTRAAGSRDVAVSVAVRPRDVNFLPRAVPVLFTGAVGDVRWSGGALEARDLAFHHSQAKISLDGRMDRLDEAAPFDLRFEVADLYLDREIREAVPGAKEVWDAYDFSGSLNLRSGSVGRDVEGGPLRFVLEAEFEDGEMTFHGYEDGDGVRHGFAYPIANVRGTVRVRSPVEDGALEVALEELHGRHGDTEVRARGRVVEWPDHRARIEVGIEAENVPLDGDIRRASHAMEGHFRTWSPRGTLARVAVRVHQDPDRDRTAHTDIFLEMDGRAGFTWEGLTLPLERVRGTVAVQEPFVGDRRTSIASVRGLTAEADRGTLAAEGSIEGVEELVHLRIRASGIHLDGELERAFREAGVRAAVEVYDRAAPAGIADAELQVSGPAATRTYTFDARLLDVEARGWGDIRFPVAGMTGSVRLEPDALVFAGVRGVHEGREVALDGTVRGLAKDTTVDLTVATTGLPIDGSIRGILGGLADRLQGYFDAVKPAPGLRGDARIRLAGPVDALDPVVELADIRGGIAPLDLRDFSLAGGRATFEKGVVRLEDLHGTLGDREIRVRSGTLRVDPGEGSLALEVRRLRFPRDLLGILEEETVAAIEEAVPDRFLSFDALDVHLSEGWRRVELRGTALLSPLREDSTGGLQLEGAFDFRRPGIVLLRGPAEGGPRDLSGTLGFSRAALKAGLEVKDLSGTLDLAGSLGPGGEGIRARLSGARGRVEGRELKDTSAEILLHDGVLVLRELRGNLARGQLGASIQVGGERAFEGSVQLDRAGAAAFFAPDDPKSGMTGDVSISLPRFWKGSGPRGQLAGRGVLTVANAKLLKVPVFDGIYGFFRIADVPQFETAKVEFEFQGERVGLDAVDIESRVLGLHKASGRSSAWLDGRLDVKLTPDFKVIPDWIRIPFSWIVGPFVQRIHTVYVRGTIQSPVVSNEFLPALFTKDIQDRAVLSSPPAFTVRPAPPWEF